MTYLHFYSLIFILYSCQSSDFPIKIEAEPNYYTWENIETYPIDKSTDFDQWTSTGWNIYKDIMFPGTDIHVQVSHQKFENSPTLLCEITGGDQYNNVFFTNTIAKSWEGNHWYFKDIKTMKLSMDFYPTHIIDCMEPNDSEYEGLEFTMHSVKTPFSWLFGMQWSKESVWSIWNDEKVNGKAVGWENVKNLNDCILEHQWNHIEIVGHIKDNTLEYDTMTLNGHTTPLNISKNKVTIPDGWVENFIQVGFQINGNTSLDANKPKQVDPVQVHLKNVQLQVY